MSSDSDDDQLEHEHRHEPSAIARRLAELKESSFRAVKERERVPQPLFWSLFRSKLEDIKREKQVTRALREVLDGGDDGN